jgi:hypothetical protein
MVENKEGIRNYIYRCFGAKERRKEMYMSSDLAKKQQKLITFTLKIMTNYGKELDD